MPGAPPEKIESVGVPTKQIRMGFRGSVRVIRVMLVALILLISACGRESNEPVEKNKRLDVPFVLVLGVAQDGGYPQAGCEKDCCLRSKSGSVESAMVSCLGLIDPAAKKYWLFDATPDFPRQIALVKSRTGLSAENLAGIFLTHGHIGHYTGLVHLGHEVMGASGVPVYAMPRMEEYLAENGPWSQLVKFGNIGIESLKAGEPVVLSGGLTVTPLLVPHRDEFTETAGFTIRGPSRRLTFIPDIDKWNLWDQVVAAVVKENDYALLDATFFDSNELPGRDMSGFPHPFVVETMEILAGLAPVHRQKVHFIHFNHTNPLLDSNAAQSQQVIGSGFGIAREADVFPL